MTDLAVPSRPFWTPTGVSVVPNQPVQFKAAGNWRDWYIDCGPDGYDRWYLQPLAPFRRVPNASWFCLCVALDQDLSTAVPIGAAKQVRFDRAGMLFAFANDVSWAYGNNSGEVTLTIS
ncbi:MAG TPA: hypothetical protein VKQ70_08940 [Caulobacteraceae bacterium]|jgi:hypothetical protein|nr:hypothetical protein [Caulobacteraceae bacterium]